MDALKKIREDDLNSFATNFVGGTRKRKFNSIPCGKDNSLIREGDEIRIVEGQEDVSYTIDRIPFELQFSCSEKKDACYKHEESESIVCLTKAEQNIETGKLYKLSYDKPVELKETDGLHMCMHQEMKDFVQGSSTIFHKDATKCKKLYDDAMNTCETSGSNDCHKQVKLITKTVDTCNLSKDNFSKRLAAFPYTSNPDFEEFSRITPKKDFKIIMDNKSEWANSVRNGEQIVAPATCTTLGAACGLNNDVYYGQCVNIVDGTTQAVCKPILNEFDLKDARNWMDSRPEIKEAMKNELSCGLSTYKNFDICREFNDSGKCIHTVQRYEASSSGDICDNPYYKKDNKYVCIDNKHALSGENEFETHIIDEKMGFNDLRTWCLAEDKGNGVIFTEENDGKRVCNILLDKAVGNPINDLNTFNGAVCLPMD